MLLLLFFIMNLIAKNQKCLLWVLSYALEWSIGRYLYPNLFESMVEIKIEEKLSELYWYIQR